MIRTAEAVLDGHPDKFCDIISDNLIAEGYRADPDCYGQIEVAIWSDAVWLSGVVVTSKPLNRPVREIVTQIGNHTGYGDDNHISAAKYRLINEICFMVEDPRPYTEVIHDQSIVVGWAGYDRKTHFLAPEQFLVHSFKQVLDGAFKNNGRLSGQGPDGKFLIHLREEGGKFILEHVLATIQHRENFSLPDLSTCTDEILGNRYKDLQSRDSRWISDWRDVELLVNPNGPLIRAGSDGDNGQTGRKLVMDYYGPRVPIGGGALSGKDLAHIDRIAAYKARHAAVLAVAAGAAECKVTLTYSPARDEPLDVIYDMRGRGVVLGRKEFDYNLIKQEFLKNGVDVGSLGNGSHFYDPTLSWNLGKLK